METCNWKGLLCGKAFNACFFGKSLSSICFSLARVPLTAKQTTFLPFCVPWSDTDHRLARTIVLSRNYSIILRAAQEGRGEKNPKSRSAAFVFLLPVTTTLMEFFRPRGVLHVKTLVSSSPA